MKRLSRNEFKTTYGDIFTKIFEPKSSKEDPWPLLFRDENWMAVAVVSLHGLEEPEYGAVVRAAKQMGDKEVVITDAEAEPRHQQAVVFRWPASAGIWDMYSEGPFGVDAALFGASGSWGIYFCWEPRIAYVGGTPEFMGLFLDAIGGVEGAKRGLRYMVEETEAPEELRIMAVMLNHLGWAEELMGDKYPGSPGS